MSEKLTLKIDGVTVEASAGQTLLQAADAAGIYIPRLCAHPELEAYGACRVCTVMVNGRPQAACTTPAAEGMVVENETEDLRRHRRSLIDMLFVEGNHFCMFCERSGSCELQALAYRFGIQVPEHPYQYPKRELNASHPDVAIDHGRCILCARCIRASRDIDGKHVFQFVGRGKNKKIGVNSRGRLSDTRLAAADKAASVCPVGAILRKRTAFQTPIGARPYDRAPIGSEIEARRKPRDP